MNEKRYRALLENTFDAVAFLDSSGTTLYVSPAMTRILGYDPEDVLGVNGLQYIYPDDLERVAADLQNLMTMPGGSVTSTFRVVSKDGTILPVEATGTNRLDDPEVNGLIINYRDVTGRVMLEEALDHREAILAAVASSAEGFLGTAHWTDNIEGVLASLGRAASVTRTFIFQFTEAPDGRMLASELHSWVASSSVRDVTSDQLQALPIDELGFTRWIDTLAIGDPIEGIVRNLPAPERAFLEPLGVKSIVLVPIFVENALWGDLGFEDNVKERRWSRSEIEALGTAARIIGAAIESDRARDRLEQNIVALKHTDEMRSRLLASLVNAQESERQRIASEVHDDSIQVMIAAGLRLQMLKRRLSSEDAEAIAGIEDDIERAVGRLRNLIFELVPPALTRHGIATALTDYLDRFAEDTGIDARLDDQLTVEPSSATRVLAYRISQEALTNVRKHAKASSVEIVLSNKDDGLHATITDDGRGFSANDSLDPAPGHIGLPSMRERAEIAGGWWKIESAVGAGTTVEFWIPDVVETPGDLSTQ